MLNAPTPWQVYAYAIDTTSETAPAKVVRMVGRSRKVLEVGSGPGSITRLLCERNRCAVTALDIDPEALKKVAPFCQRTLSVDLNNAQWAAQLEGENFDVVVAADVLEHLYDPLSALIAMKSLLRPQGCAVISLPHTAHASVIACLLNEDFEYRKDGLLDRTHIRFFGIKNMQNLIEQAGMKIIDAQFYVWPSEETALAHHWAALSPAARDIILTHKFSQVYQVVIKAVPENSHGTAISLMDSTI